MPEVNVFVSRELFESTAWLKDHVEAICRSVVSSLFGIVEPGAPEVNWLCRERSIGAATLAVRVEWTVGPHGFPEESADGLFVQKVRDVLHERLAEVLFPMVCVTITSIDVWARPQRDTCWGRLTQADWMARE